MVAGHSRDDAPDQALADVASVRVFRQWRGWLTIAALRIDGESFNFGYVTWSRWAANRRAKRWARRLLRLGMPVTVAVATNAEASLSTSAEASLGTKAKGLSAPTAEASRRVRDPQARTL